jgi:hypothetical protein
VLADFSGGLAMLEMRPNCECCNRNLSPSEPGAMICTFECTFCETCATAKLNFICPNCGGDLVTRPARPVRLLHKYPASLNRVFKPEGCNSSAHLT